VVQSEVVNLNSLNLVSDELVITIEQSAGQLEQFYADRGNKELLETCIAGIEQISGTLRLIQLHGADLLAEEILLTARQLVNEDEADLDESLSVVTASFFILPRYLEYAQQTRKGMPVLLIPYINELRQHRRVKLLPDSHFFHADVSPPHPASGHTVIGEDFVALVRRFRHMYQVGLLNTLQGKQTKSALGIMARALERLESITGDRPMGKLWWVASAALVAISNANMELTKPRKLLLTALDRKIKPLLKGLSELEQTPPDDLLVSLVYLIALTDKPDAKAEQVLATFSVEPLKVTDTELRNERESLKGPSANTVASVAAVLKDELRAIKDILENASETGGTSLDDCGELITTLGKVADILAVVGLSAASSTLKEEIVKIESWQGDPEGVDAKALLEVADALLYVESTVSSLEMLNLSDEKLAKVNSLARREVIAASQLFEAELLVIKEAESGLALVKRALSSFSDSNYDRGHIQNVGATLNSVRGGMIVLSLPRAAAVVACCVEFIDGCLMQNEQPAALRQLLETFADAVIGLEYYLDAVRTDKEADDTVLEIAEESLQALGYRVH